MKKFIQKISLIPFLFLILMSINFEAKSQDPSSSTTDIKRQSITVNAMKNQPEKYFSQFFSELSDNYKVTQFNISVARKEGEGSTIKVQGNTLNEKCLELISTIIKDDIIIIDDIKVENDKNTKYLMPIIIDIK